MKTLRLCLLFVSSAVLAQASAPVTDAAYPSRPVRLSVAVPRGGAADFTACIVAQKLTDALGQNLVVENRGGAGGTIASELASKVTPDGYAHYSGPR